MILFTLVVDYHIINFLHLIFYNFSFSIDSILFTWFVYNNNKLFIWCLLKIHVFLLQCMSLCCILHHPLLLSPIKCTYRPQEAGARLGLAHVSLFTESMAWSFDIMKSSDLIKKECLDYGGFGEVFLCYHKTLGHVAQKTVYTGPPRNEWVSMCPHNTRQDRTGSEPDKLKPRVTDKTNRTNQTKSDKTRIDNQTKPDKTRLNQTRPDEK